MSVCFFVPADQGTSVGVDEPGDGEAGSPEGESSAADNASAVLQQFWEKVTEDVRKVTPDDFKTQTLPLARIKKIMKLDEDVKMISAEAPVLFARAAEIFIHELTLRAWVHTEDNKRRTLQRNDIAMAISKSDQFDFLIDIVPRHEIKPAPKPKEEPPRASSSNNEQVQYYFQLAQQHQAALQSTPQQPQAQQIILQPQIHTVQTSSGGASGAGGGAQQATVQQPVHILQQLLQPSGEVQQVPIQLTQAQMNLIRMQMQNNSGQPLIIQAQPQHSQPQIIQVSQQQQQQPQQQQVYLTQVATTQDGD